MPGCISSLWFEATATGRFPLQCAECCGTDHARMLGEVVVMAPDLYVRWSAAQPQADTRAREGAAVFTAAGCSGCHAAASAVHAPLLDGVYGRAVNLADGRTVIADEAYIRDSILLLRRDGVAGYEPIMATDFDRILSEGEFVALVAYIRELGAGGPPGDETLRSPALERSR